MMNLAKPRPASPEETKRRCGGLLAPAILIVLLLTGSTAAAQTLGFNPAAISVDCGGTVDVDVVVDDITDLRGYSLYVQFDPNVVVVDDVVIGADFLAACADNYFYSYDPVAGILQVDATLLGCSLTTTDPKSLMTITFSPGANKDPSALAITGATILRDSDNVTLGYTPTPGSLENICNTAPVVVPATFGLDENSANGTAVGTVAASDIDGDGYTFAITGGNAAGGFTIDPGTGAITVADVGVLDFETTPTFTLTVTATDDDPNTPKQGTAPVTINLNDVNEAPELGAIGNQLVDEQVLLAFTASATDPDLPLDTLTFSLDATAIGFGMAMTPGGDFTWTPTEVQGPGDYDATITVSDGALTDFELITITVAEVNVAPTVTDIPDQPITEGQTFTLINLDDFVSDPDHADDQLSWAATGEIELTVSIVARVATITAPDLEWNGSEVITFTATDPGLLSGADAATFTVTGVNDPPTVTNPGDQTDNVLDVVSLQIVASDIDGDDLSYSATGLPNGLTIDPAGGEISGTVACDAVSGSVTVTVTDDGTGNLATPVTFNWTIDALALPAGLTSLAAAQVTTGNDTDGTTSVHLTWTPPADTAATVAIYRKGFGSYPEYDDDGGSVPGLPLDTWTLVNGSVAASAGEFFDEPTTRDFWYYAAVVANSCGEISGPSNLTGGTLNYNLGDVSNGLVPGQGDNEVTTVDITLLGTYYATVPTDNTTNFLDVGPTTDFSVLSRPTTDNQIEFEDLIIMAINFNEVNKSLTGPEPAVRNDLTVFVPEQADEGGVLEVSLWLAADGGIKGASIPLVWDPDVVNPVAFAAGGLAADQIGQGVVLSPTPGIVDVALFGDATKGFSGEGLLATVTFEVLADGDAGIEVGEIRARDTTNKSLDLEATVTMGTPDMMDIPAVSFMRDNYPNPFNPLTTLKYGVAVEGRIAIDVYDVRGRLVTSLLNEIVRPGTYTIVWDGTDSGGRRVSSGVYMARFKALDQDQVQRMALVK